MENFVGDNCDPEDRENKAVENWGKLSRLTFESSDGGVLLERSVDDWPPLCVLGVNWHKMNGKSGVDDSWRGTEQFFKEIIKIRGKIQRHLAFAWCETRFSRPGNYAFYKDELREDSTSEDQLTGNSKKQGRIVSFGKSKTASITKTRRETLSNSTSQTMPPRLR